MLRFHIFPLFSKAAHSWPYIHLFLINPLWNVKFWLHIYTNVTILKCVSIYWGLRGEQRNMEDVELMKQLLNPYITGETGRGLSERWRISKEAESRGLNIRIIKWETHRWTSGTTGRIFRCRKCDSRKKRNFNLHPGHESFACSIKSFILISIDKTCMVNRCV